MVVHRFPTILQSGSALPLSVKRMFSICLRKNKKFRAFYRTEYKHLSFSIINLYLVIFFKHSQSGHNILCLCSMFNLRQFSVKKQNTKKKYIYILYDTVVYTFTSLWIIPKSCKNPEKKKKSGSILLWLSLIQIYNTCVWKWLKTKHIRLFKCKLKACQTL